jgi:hypothetical protein
MIVVAGQLEQDSRERTAGRGQLGQLRRGRDSRNKTAGKDRQNIIFEIRQQEQDSQKI